MTSSPGWSPRDRNRSSLVVRQRLVREVEHASRAEGAATFQLRHQVGDGPLWTTVESFGGQRDRDRQVPAQFGDPCRGLRSAGDPVLAGDPGEQRDGLLGREHVEEERLHPVEAHQAAAAGDQHQARGAARQQRPDLVLAGRVVEHRELLDRGEPAFLQPRVLRTQRRSRRHLRGRAVPLRQCLCEKVRRGLGVVLRARVLCGPDQLVELVQVELTGFDDELVAVPRPGHQPFAEHLAQPRHVRAQVRLRRHGRRLPDRLGQLRDAHGLVRVQQQHGQHGTLPRPAQLQLRPRPPYRERAEHQELHPQRLSFMITKSSCLRPRRGLCAVWAQSVRAA